jgi:hypothetical protein
VLSARESFSTATAGRAISACFDQLHGGLYEFTRLALDLFELLNDSGEVIR